MLEFSSMSVMSKRLKLLPKMLKILKIFLMILLERTSIRSFSTSSHISSTKMISLELLPKVKFTNIPRKINLMSFISRESSLILMKIPPPLPTKSKSLCRNKDFIGILSMPLLLYIKKEVLGLI